MQDAYDHGVAGLEIGQGGVPTTDQLVAIYNKANGNGTTISLKVASALPVGDLRQHRPVRAPHAAGDAHRRQRGRELHRRRAGHRDRHDRRRRGLPLHRDDLPRDGRDRSRPLVLREPHVDADGHQHERLPGRLDRRHAQLDRPGCSRRRAVGRDHVPRDPLRPDARDAQHPGHQGAHGLLRHVPLRPARPAREGQQRRLLRRLPYERSVGHPVGAVELEHGQRVPVARGL